jgi:hypothetical protein
MADIWPILVAFGVPTAVTGFFFWLLKRHIDERDKRAEERDRDREELDRVILRSTTAAIALGEATARAVQRIPDAHCNGDMKAALEYAAQIKHQQRDFLTGLGVHALHDDY